MAHPAKQKKSPRRRLIWLVFLSILIGLAAFFLVVLVFYPAYADLIDSPLAAAIETASLESFTSLVTLAAVAGGFVFWVIDRRQKENAEAAQEQTLSFQLFQTIHDRLVNPEQEEARRWIITNIPIKASDQSIEEWFAQASSIIEAKPANWKGFRSPGQTYIKQVLNNLDFIGFVSEHFWNAGDSDIEWLSPPVTKVWLRLRPYVQHLSTLRKEPDYYREASKFGEFCIQWRADNNLPEAEYVEGL